MKFTKTKMKKLLKGACFIGRENAHLDDEQFEEKFNQYFQLLDDMLLEDLLE